uniref:Adenylyltransferase and sulfurtransferase MOCS3 homolog Adenylyltransferase Sulfurtransferase n=1 Tax=Rhabditophanes sp. KR3021 TaxID=114890 RepID=A0AC35U114_9BILA
MEANEVDNNNRRDDYYRLTKEDAYRARSAYKLLQIDEKFGIFKDVVTVVDLCAAPGSWTQVCVDKLAEVASHPVAQHLDILKRVKIIGVDIQPMAKIIGADLIQGDITSTETMGQIIKEAKGRVDLVLCDGACDKTGIIQFDQILQADLLSAALSMAALILVPGGAFVSKIFVSDNVNFIKAQCELLFKEVHIFKPDSSRHDSAEHFVICKNFEQIAGYKPNLSSIAHNADYDWRTKDLVGINRKIVPFMAAGDMKGWDESRSMLCTEGTDIHHLLDEAHIFGKEVYQFPTAEELHEFFTCLNKEHIQRYSRQLILKDFGIEAQRKLINSSILVVGGGGLGCPVAVYLAAAGVGRIGIADHDGVSIDNLHRQFAHKETNVGLNKSESLKQFIRDLNSTVQVDTFDVSISAKNVKDICEGYDVIADCSDNVVTRYLLNDAAVLYRKVLISGSALGWDGQLTTYNYSKETPCYRCLLPVPPRPESVTNCSDGGVLGPIVGMIGSMQALEAIKIMAGLEPNYAGKMLVFDGYEGRTRTIKLRGRNGLCVICGNEPTITDLVDYELFCSSKATDKVTSLNVLDDEDRIDVHKYAKNEIDDCLLIDCRPEAEFDICHFNEAHNIPLKKIEKMEIEELKSRFGDKSNVLVICHRGNDSQLAVKYLKDKFVNESIIFKDIIGGYNSWSYEINNNFPVY